MTIFINNIIFLVLNLVMAMHHANLIKAQKRVRHGLWGGLYLAACLLVGYLFSGWYVPMLLCLRGWFYSPILNVCMFKPIDYWSLTSTSILDKIERTLFKNFWITRAVYFVLWTLTIIHYAANY